ncbi:hypothetical protein D3C86_1587940 [compost metagenome]
MALTVLPEAQELPVEKAAGHQPAIATDHNHHKRDKVVAKATDQNLKADHLTVHLHHVVEMKAVVVADLPAVAEEVAAGHHVQAEASQIIFLLFRNTHEKTFIIHSGYSSHYRKFICSNYG